MKTYVWAVSALCVVLSAVLIYRTSRKSSDSALGVDSRTAGSSLQPDSFPVLESDLAGLPDDFREAVLKEENPQIRRMTARLWQLQFTQGIDVAPALDDTLLVLSAREPVSGAQSQADFASYTALPGLAMAWSHQGPLASHAGKIIAEAERFATSGDMVEQHCAATLLWTLIVDPEPGRDAAITKRLQSKLAELHKNETIAMLLARDIQGLVEARRKAGRTGLPETVEAALPS